MRKRLMRSLVVTCSIVLLVFQAAARSDQAASRASASDHLVIISLDGFPGWALDDPKLPVPTLRRLAADGAVAKGMRPVNPSVTWPNHTTMVTGVTPAKHGVLFNGILVREPGVPPRIEPWRDRNEMVRVKTLYDAVHERGLTTAQVDWVAIQNAPTITWEFRERVDPASEIAREMVKAGLVSEQDLATFSSQNILWRDHVWTMAAAHILARHRPNLLLFHLLNLDSTHHRYAPRTHAGMTAMAYLDTQVGTIMRTLEETGLAPRTTVFVLSDHGFKAVKRQIRPNAAFLKAGLLEAEGAKIVRSQAYSVPEGGTAMVYVTVPDVSGEILARVKGALQGIEGIDRIVEPSEYGSYGLPNPADNNQMGALFLTAKDGYAFTNAIGDEVVVNAPAGSLGAHGYLGTDPDLRALFIASGRGIKKGVMLDVIDSVDVAPTAARLLNVELPNVQGKVLTEILSAEATVGGPWDGAAAPPQGTRETAKPSERSAPKAPIDHLRAARASVDDIEGETLTAEAAETLTEVKARLATLEDTYLSHGRRTVTTEKTPSGSTRVRIGQRGTWTAQVPDIDKLLGQLLGARTIARETQRDAAIKRTLTSSRSHLTAFAKAASGTTGPPR